MKLCIAIIALLALGLLISLVSNYRYRLIRSRVVYKVAQPLSDTERPLVWQEALDCLEQKKSEEIEEKRNMAISMREDIVAVMDFLESDEGVKAKQVLAVADKNILLGCFGGFDRRLLGGQGLYKIGGDDDYFVIESPTPVTVEEAVGFIYQYTPEDIEPYGSVLNKIKTEVDQVAMSSR